MRLDRMTSTGFGHEDRPVILSLKGIPSLLCMMTNKPKPADLKSHCSCSSKLIGNVDIPVYLAFFDQPADFCCK